LDKKKIFSPLNKVKEKSKSLTSKVDFDLYDAAKLMGALPFKGLFNIDVTGLENIPETGPVILAANHRSFMDSMFIPHVLKRRVTFVAKQEYFDSIKTRWIFKSTGQIPVRRDSANSGLGALEAAKEVLKDGGVFVIYPEGTRTRDGFLHRGHTGVARLALETDATVIPVGLIGTEHVQDVHEKVPRVGKKIEVHFGKPINVDKYKSDDDAKLVLRNLTDEIMYEIFSLSKYGYVDSYASTIPL